MEFKILSHACLLVRTPNTSIILDPWLLGSCYWRSWWNFPVPTWDVNEISEVDAVVISHIHWDHWHGPTLKKLLKGKPVLVSDEPGLRSEADLRSIGFGNVRRLPHGLTTLIGDISITMYQFGLYLTDSAIVIEADGVKLLNANDAKISGWALRDVIKRHGKFDFALRSHSSANARICYKIDGQDNFAGDDREHYFRSYCAFMDVVKPRYALPFASNHCHLHDDVFALNSYISNPQQLRNFINQHRPSDWSFCLMLPGSLWSSDQGFDLQSEACFDNIESELTSYKKKVSDKLMAYTNYENKVCVDDKIFFKFVNMLKRIHLPSSVKGDVRISIRWPDGRGISRILSLPSLTIKEASFSLHAEIGLPNLVFPAVVFRDAVVKNMFHHASISKRCEFLASTNFEMKRVIGLMAVLEGVELGRYPLRRRFMTRLLLAYIRRWRELFVYAQAVWLMRVRGKPLYLAEEAILRGEI